MQALESESSPGTYETVFPDADRAFRDIDPDDKLKISVHKAPSGAAGDDSTYDGYLSRATVKACHAAIGHRNYKVRVHLDGLGYISGLRVGGHVRLKGYMEYVDLVTCLIDQLKDLIEKNDFRYTKQDAKVFPCAEVKRLLNQCKTTRLIQNKHLHGVSVRYGELCGSAIKTHDVCDSVLDAYLAALSSGTKDLLVLPSLATTLAYERFGNSEFRLAQQGFVLALDLALEANDGPPCFIALPLNVAKSHWCLVVVELQPVPQYFFYDPLGESSVIQTMEAFYRQVLATAMAHTKKSIKGCVSRMKRARPELPHQQDVYNCGVFVCAVVK